MLNWVISTVRKGRVLVRVYSVKTILCSNPRMSYHMQIRPEFG